MTMLTAADRHWIENVVIVAGSHPAKYNVFEVAEKAVLDKVQGVWVEAGACGGGQIAVMDRVLQIYGETRTLHAFDSWEGIPKATEDDDAPQKGEYGVRKEGEPLVSSGKLVTGEDNFWNNMKKWGARAENIQTHKGWLQDTLVGWNLQIGLLRIDVDLNDSVRVCMKHLWPFLVPGGYFIFDDWWVDPNPRRQIMIDASGIDLEKIVVPVVGNPGTVWGRKP